MNFGFSSYKRKNLSKESGSVVFFWTRPSEGFKKSSQNGGFYHGLMYGFI